MPHPITVKLKVDKLSDKERVFAARALMAAAFEMWPAAVRRKATEAVLETLVRQKPAS
jgi:hypothetical protein